MNWEGKVRAFIDNDELKLGELEGVSVIVLNSVSVADMDDDAQIWIAALDDEVYEQAKKITSNVLAGGIVRLIIQA